MKLVLITRILDRKDTRSGFIFDWIDALATHLDHLYVICLEKGDVSGLPANVSVESMGKERNKSRIGELMTYLGLLFRWVPKSDGVLVHMHPTYVIAGWLPIKLFGKKIVLWYTHKSINVKLKVAHALVNRVLTASEESFRLPSKKVKIVGHGIRIERFARTKKHDRKNIFEILSIGRISPAKDYETLLKAIDILVHEKNISGLKLDVYGDPALEEDRAYLLNLKQLVSRLNLDRVVSFYAGVSYGRVPELYAEADLFVNLSRTGSLDKTVLEAAAAKILVLTSNEAFYEPLRNISLNLVAEANNAELLAIKISVIRDMSQSKSEKLRYALYEWVAREHGLENLADKIIETFRL